MWIDNLCSNKCARVKIYYKCRDIQCYQTGAYHFLLMTCVIHQFCLTWFILPCAITTYTCFLTVPPARTNSLHWFMKREESSRSYYLFSVSFKGESNCILATFLGQIISNCGDSVVFVVFLLKITIIPLSFD